MCGIVFACDPSSHYTDLHDRVHRALDLIAHRGPDDDSLLNCTASINGKSAPPAVIGHRRLSIIDLSASHQPMQACNGRYALAYNGELYNYKELRKYLSLDWQFTTEGDTEVVLAGLILHGTRFLDVMDGMWALALWDSAEQSLLLVRDRMGKKPLYYTMQGNGFACASELPALCALTPDAPWGEDMASTADYFRYGYYLPGTTAYKGVREVLPGHFLTWRFDGEHSNADMQAYWRLPETPYAGTRKDAAEELEYTFLAAVKKRLVADVEVGAFLSGGVDSSLVAAAMARIHKHPAKTFTIGFGDPSYDESNHAKRVAGFCGTEHFCERFAGWTLESAGEFVLRHAGQPFADESIFPVASVSELAARHVKVALSGDGADEFFSGYQRYRAWALMRWYSRIPPALRQAAVKTVGALPEPHDHHSHSLLKKAHLFLQAAGREGEHGNAPYIAPLLYSQAEFNGLAPGLSGMGHAPPSFAGIGPEWGDRDGVAAMMAADALVYLPQDILIKLDRATMAHSLEARTPFLDRHLVELAFSLPAAWHGDALGGKRMLRRGLGKLLPGFVWKRKKQGFAVPVATHFPGLCGALRDLLASQPPSSPLDSSAVARMIGEQESGARDHGHRLWGVYVYLLWKTNLNSVKK